MPSFNSIQSRVDDMTNYYGKSLSTSNDLKSNVCTIEETTSHREADVYAKLHPEVLSRSYGNPPTKASHSEVEFSHGEVL